MSIKTFVENTAPKNLRRFNLLWVGDVCEGVNIQKVFYYVKIPVYKVFMMQKIENADQNNKKNIMLSFHSTKIKSTLEMSSRRWTHAIYHSSIRTLPKRILKFFFAKWLVNFCSCGQLFPSTQKNLHNHHKLFLLCTISADSFQSYGFLVRLYVNI